MDDGKYFLLATFQIVQADFSRFLFSKHYNQITGRRQAWVCVRLPAVRFVTAGAADVV